MRYFAFMVQPCLVFGRSTCYYAVPLLTQLVFKHFVMSDKSTDGIKNGTFIHINFEINTNRHDQTHPLIHLISALSGVPSTDVSSINLRLR